MPSPSAALTVCAGGVIENAPKITVKQRTAMPQRFNNLLRLKPFTPLIIILNKEHDLREFILYKERQAVNDKISLTRHHDE